MTVTYNTNEPSNQQVIPPDELSVLASAVDKLKNPQTAAAKVESLIGEHGLNRYQLGAVLLKMRSKEWTCGYKSFDELCEDRFGIHRRTADYYIQVFAWVDEAGLSSAEIQGVQWAKVRVLATKVPASEAYVWMAKAKDMSCQQLNLLLKQKHVEPNKTQLVSQVFKMDPEKKEMVDIALQKIKAQTGTKSDSHALYLMAVAMGSGAVAPGKMAELKALAADIPSPEGGSPDQPPEPSNAAWSASRDMQLRLLMKQAGPEKTMSVLKKVFPTVLP